MAYFKLSGIWDIGNLLQSKFGPKHDDDVVDRYLEHFHVKLIVFRKVNLIRKIAKKFDFRQKSYFDRGIEPLTL
jgi:hypothetical protein